MDVTRSKKNELYNSLKNYVLTDTELKFNGYPEPNRFEKDKAIIRYYNQQYLTICNIPNSRICARCSVLYEVDLDGFSIYPEECVYHAKRSYVSKGKKVYPCCYGTEAVKCSRNKTHVSDNFDPNNLTGFVETYDKELSESEHGIFALDCERCFTTQGSEVTNVTIVDSDCKIVYQEMILPDNPIIDYNTPFSGIKKEDMKDVVVNLSQVQEALLNIFSDKTILIGHSLNNDLCALKLCHKFVIDTSVIFPHKKGPPMKIKLQTLAKEYLQREIQGSTHSSCEDAVACMDLMKWKHDHDWKLLTPARKLRRSQNQSDMKSQQQLTPPQSVERRDNGGRRCRVVFSYVPQHEDELSLGEGDVINVLQEVEEGWWKGLLKGKIGMFPSNFVEDCDQGEDSRSNIYSMEPRITEINGNPQAPVAGATLNDKIETNGIRPSANSAFHPVNYPKLGDLKTNDVSDKSSKMESNTLEKERLEAASKEKFKSPIDVGDKKPQTNGTNSSYSKPTTPSSAPLPPELPPKPVRELARVVFPYAAEHDDELELIEGDLITILNKDLEDKGWWKGEINSKVGVFPDNFVNIISQEENMKPPRPEKRPNVAQNKVMRTSSSSSTSNAPIAAKEKDSTPPPPLPNKKLVPPPPLPTEKKPAPPDAYQRTLTNGTENSSLAGDTKSLTLSRETPLTHVQRPKGPSNRRPPSQFLRDHRSSGNTDNDNVSSEDESSTTRTDSFSEDTKTDSEPFSNGLSGGGQVSAAISVSPPQEDNRPPWFKELRENQKKKRLSGLFSVGDGDLSNAASSISSSPPAVPSLHSRTSSPKVKSPRYSSSGVVSPVQSQTTFKEEEQMDGVKSYVSTTIREAPDKMITNGIESISLEAKVDSIYKEILPKVRSLEIRLEEQDTRHMTAIQLLTKELDDERKTRACLQIEVDRLKKLLNSKYAHV